MDARRQPEVRVPATPGPAAPVDAPPSDQRSSLTRGTALVTPALTLLNLAGYVLAVAASRTLPKSEYGELSALLGVLVVATVPALGVQAVTARSVARRPPGEQPGGRERALLVRACAAAAVVTVVAAAAAPLLAVFLHTSLTGPLWLAAQLAPWVLLSAAMGLLQGAERFLALAAVVVVQAAAKAVGVVPLLTGGATNQVLAALTGGVAVAALVALALVARRLHGPAPAGLPGARETSAATANLLALLVLTSLDLLLARHLLPGAESGRYSAGSVLSKAAFWLPQALAVVAFPRLSDPESGAVVLRRAALVVTALGVLEVLGSWLLAAPVLRLTFGSGYTSLAPVAPLWVVQGAALALVQLLLYRAIAVRDAVPGRVVAAAVVVEAVALLALRPRTSAGVVTVAATTAVLLALVLLTRSLWRRGGRAPSAGPARPSGAGAP